MIEDANSTDGGRTLAQAYDLFHDIARAAGIRPGEAMADPSAVVDRVRELRESADAPKTAPTTDDTLVVAVAAANFRARKLHELVQWVLGERGDFPHAPDARHWRTDVRLKLVEVLGLPEPTVEAYERDKSDLDRLRAALRHIADYNVSPAILFAEHVLAGDEVAVAHRKNRAKVRADWSTVDDVAERFKKPDPAAVRSTVLNLGLHESQDHFASISGAGEYLSPPAAELVERELWSRGHERAGEAADG